MTKKRLNPTTKIKRCPVCKRTFYAYAKSKKNHSHTRSNRFKRPARAVTCSKRCSKIYTRNWHRYND